MEQMVMYTDGGARGNPGPAASAAVLFDTEGKKVASVARYLGSTTNNQAEYTAIIIGMEKARELGVTFLDVRMDSELAVKQLNGEYKVKNAEIGKRFAEVWKLKSQFSRVTFTHVRRAQNKDADALVNETLDAQKKNRTAP